MTVALGAKRLQFPVLNRKQPPNSAGGTSGMCQEQALQRQPCCRRVTPASPPRVGARPDGSCHLPWRMACVRSLSVLVFL
jgi:hypothetical protein